MRILAIFFILFSFMGQANDCLKLYEESFQKAQKELTESRDRNMEAARKDSHSQIRMNNIVSSSVYASMNLPEGDILDTMKGGYPGLTKLYVNIKERVSKYGIKVSKKQVTAALKAGLESNELCPNDKVKKTKFIARWVEKYIESHQHEIINKKENIVDTEIQKDVKPGKPAKKNGFKVLSKQ